MYRLLLWVVPALCTALRVDGGLEYNTLVQLKMKSASGSEDMPREHFDEYIEKFDRQYIRDSPEYMHRLEVFGKRFEIISGHNSRPDRLWTAGVSPLTDRTDNELSRLYGWRRLPHPTASSPHGTSLLSEQVEIAVSTGVDWRFLKMASNIPDQGTCGSCWALATVTILEAHYEIKTKKTRNFSSQQLINCVPNPEACGGQGGCQGATVELGLAYVGQMGLLDSSRSGVPYAGVDMPCGQPLPPAAMSLFLGGAHIDVDAHHSDGRASIGMKHYYTLPSNELAPLMAALQHGPVAVAVAADTWVLYSKGVFDGCTVDAVVNHAVVAFGYGTTTDNVKYWIIRNSWGAHWGENGYIRLLRNENGDHYCGTDTDPGAGIACKPYPSTQTVCGMCGILLDSTVVIF